MFGRLATFVGPSVVFGPTVLAVILLTSRPNPSGVVIDGSADSAPTPPSRVQPTRLPSPSPWPTVAPRSVVVTLTPTAMPGKSEPNVTAVPTRGQPPTSAVTAVAPSSVALTIPPAITPVSSDTAPVPTPLRFDVQGAVAVAFRLQQGAAVIHIGYTGRSPFNAVLSPIKKGEAEPLSQFDSPAAFEVTRTVDIPKDDDYALLARGEVGSWLNVRVRQMRPLPTPQPLPTSKIWTEPTRTAFARSVDATMTAIAFNGRATRETIVAGGNATFTAIAGTYQSTTSAGCGSRGGPGYRRPNGKCASWSARGR